MMTTAQSTRHNNKQYLVYPKSITFLVWHPNLQVLLLKDPYRNCTYWIYPKTTGIYVIELYKCGQHTKIQSRILTFWLRNATKIDGSREVTFRRRFFISYYLNIRPKWLTKHVSLNTYTTFSYGDIRWPELDLDLHTYVVALYFDENLFIPWDAFYQSLG